MLKIRIFYVILQLPLIYSQNHYINAMDDLFERVEEQLKNNWPVSKEDIEELLNLSRIASHILDRLVDSGQAFQSLRDK